MHRTKHQDNSGEAEALRVACRQEGCPICTVTSEQVARSMDNWSFEGFTDVAHRQEVMRARGFCPAHTWQLARGNNAFQLAVVYEPILSTMLEELDAEQEHPQQERKGSHWFTEVRRLFQPGTAPWRDTIPAAEQCAFCKFQAVTEQRLSERLIELLRSDEAMPDRLSRSTGLCRVHLALAVRYAEARAPEQRSVLLRCQRSCLQRVLGEVRELVRKHDYRFRQEPRGDEMTAWRRAVALCVGNVGVHV